MAQGKEPRARGRFARRSAILNHLASVATLMRPRISWPQLRERPHYEHSNRKS